jgi:hypothetical protein
MRALHGTRKKCLTSKADSVGVPERLYYVESGQLKAQLTMRVRGW